MRQHAMDYVLVSLPHGIQFLFESIQCMYKTSFRFCQLLKKRKKESYSTHARPRLVFSSLQLQRAARIQNPAAKRSFHPFLASAYRRGQFNARARRSWSGSALLLLKTSGVARGRGSRCGATRRKRLQPRRRPRRHPRRRRAAQLSVRGGESVAGDGDISPARSARLELGRDGCLYSKNHEEKKKG